MNITLRAGERIYVNGAVLRVDRKATLELMNDATFLLEAHVMQAQDATTPLRQIYFWRSEIGIEGFCGRRCGIFFSFLRPAHVRFGRRGRLTRTGNY